MNIEEEIRKLQLAVEKLEEHSHPAKDMCEFDGYQELMARIKKLEENNGNN